MPARWAFHEPHCTPAPLGRVRQTTLAALRSGDNPQTERGPSLSPETGNVTLLSVEADDVAALRGTVAAHGGELADSEGDEVLAVFRTSAAALWCAATLRTSFGGVRVGVNSGEVTRRGRGCFGAAVVVARRLRDRAEPGHVLVSELVEPPATFELQDVGALSLQGLADPLRAYELALGERVEEGPAVRREERRGDGEVPLPRPLAGPEATAFVGRREELERLRSVLARARAGDRELCFVAGDPGVGKTRLARELAAGAQADGWLVLYGHPQQENVVPFQPFVQALRHYVAHAPAAVVRAQAGDGVGPELGRLLPELHERLPGPMEPEPADPDTARFRLFDATARLIFGIARERRLLLVLDDLHWADTPTLLLLRHLVESGERAPLVVLATSRESELGPDSPLVALREELAGERIVLEGLGGDEVRQLIAAWAGDEPPARFARDLWEETSGNPFFVRAILRHLNEAGVVEGGDLPAELSLERLGVPEGVREVIWRRLSRLGEETGRVLQAAAVAGREFPAALLVRATGRSPESVREALDEAAAARILTEVPGDDRHAFAHALVRDALYEDLSATTRVRLHLRIAEALEQLGDPDDHLTELAEHFIGAAVAAGPEKALEYAGRAAQRAVDQLAYEDAARHHQRVLDALELPPRARCDTLLALGEAQSRAGETDRARAAFKEAAGLAGALGSTERLESAAIGYARRFMEEPGVVDHELIGLLEQALEAGATRDSVTRVRLLGHLCGALYYADARERIDELSRAALEMAGRLGEPEALAYAHNARRRALWRPEHLQERLAAARGIVENAEATGNRELALQGRGWLVVDLLEACDLDGMEEQIDAFERGAKGLRQPLYEWNLRVWSAMRAAMTGELDRAEALSQEALAAGQRAESLTAPHYFAVQLFSLRRDQGRLGELEAAAQEFVRRFPAIPSWRGALAMVYAETGNHEAAREQFDLMAANDFADLPLDGNWLIGVTLASEVCAQLGDARRAATLSKLLQPYEDALVVVALAAVCYGPAARFLGLLAATEGRTEDAARHFEAAIERSAAIGAEPILARTRSDYAHMLVARGAPGDLDRAHELASAAGEAAERLGMPVVAEAALRSTRAAQATP